MKTLLDISDLSVSLYDGFNRYNIINDISLKIAEGKITSIVGESGSGKSLTFMSVIKLLPPSMKIDAGRIIFNGRDITEADESRMNDIRARHIGFVPQEPMTALNPVVNIEKQMVEVLVEHKLADYKTAFDRARKALIDVGIDPLKIKSYPHNFSGGQRQRILIAMAMMCEPELIIADEPTTSLDVVTQLEILNLFKKIVSLKKNSVVLISHNMSVVYNYSDYLYVMYLGQIVEEGYTDCVIENPSHPYTSALLNSVIRIGVKDRLKPVEGVPPELKNWNKGCRFYSRCPFRTDVCFNNKPPRKERKYGYYSCWNR